MARVCQITGKSPLVGNNVSHAQNKTKRRFLPNLHYRRFWVESENRFVRLRVSSAGLRIIDKKGIDAVLADIKSGNVGSVPRQLQNMHYDGEDNNNKGQHYLYPHDFENHYVPQQYLPDNLAGKRYYEYGENKNEQAFKTYWEKIKDKIH